MANEKINIGLRNTLENALSEVKEKMSQIEVGQVFEVLKPLYPKEDVPPEIKNITIGNNRMTLPLALSGKAKRDLHKTGSFFRSFFEDSKKGDFLLVTKLKDDCFVCKNISISPDKYKKYYEKHPEISDIVLSKDDVAFGNIKRIYRGLKSLNIKELKK